jgi:hypothetical protein
MLKKITGQKSNIRRPVLNLTSSLTYCLEIAREMQQLIAFFEAIMQWLVGIASARPYPLPCSFVFLPMKPSLP